MKNMLLREEEGEALSSERPNGPYDYSVSGATSATVHTNLARIEDKYTFERVLVTRVDYYEEAGSLFISFGSRPEKTLESDARVLLGLANNGLASIEILIDNKEVAEDLSNTLKPHRYR